MNITNRPYYGQARDVSAPFYTLGNLHFNADTLTGFDPAALEGTLNFTRCQRKGRMAFNGFSAPFDYGEGWSFPPAYGSEAVRPLKLSVIDARTVRLQINLSGKARCEEPSLMLVGEPAPFDGYETQPFDGGLELITAHLRLRVTYAPFSLQLMDASGRELTRTLHSSDSRCLLNCNPLPVSYVQDVETMQKYAALSLTAKPGESFYGSGESFGPLNKAGQKLNLFTKDPHGVETGEVYKPVPFYLSSQGYGVFVHTGAPVTLDFGHGYHEAQTVFVEDSQLDVFLFAGEPKEVLGAYTALTGRAQLPPLWSFGLWMSRITYKSEAEVREVAESLKSHEIPCDVIHLDTGWFEENWRCDFQFSQERFPEPEKLLSELRQEGYRVCLWQLPYFTPENSLYGDILAQDRAVAAENDLPTSDAIIDFSKPASAAWYKDKLAALLKQGVAAIKADFGEAAPMTGRYHSGLPSLVEHNLYPLRYNRLVHEVTQEVHGESVIWARSAWAGSQRYPIHWGGDAENTNMGMLSSLRGGLSLGMCGFSFWSHDTGGFVRKTPEELYSRWSFMGIFTSHMRCHGQPPKEPWAFSPAFLERFRTQLRLRYALMPYLYEQSRKAAEAGLPVLRSMFLEFPQDLTCRHLEDQYMFGEDILAAPLFEAEAISRQVYLPEGEWLDIQTGALYEGKRWADIPGGILNGAALVRRGAVIPMVPPALTTDAIQWDSLIQRHCAEEGDTLLFP